MSKLLSMDSSILIRAILSSIIVSYPYFTSKAVDANLTDEELKKLDDAEMKAAKKPIKKK